MAAFIELNSHLNLIWLGWAMLIFFIFIPLFAMKEVSRVMGGNKFSDLFFLRKNSNY